MNASASGFFRSVDFTHVTLRVADLTRCLAFYRDTLGFRVIAQEPSRVSLSVNGSEPALLVLEYFPSASRRTPGTAGLFHIAFLYPDRASLGRALRQVVDAGIHIGAGDHGVSEAIYLDDPEGNGLELYADRSVQDWPAAQPDGEVPMYTAPVDLSSVLAEGSRSPGPLLPAETRIGHLHLCVSDLSNAQNFYADVLGFPIRQSRIPGALFLGRDGYHHHIGTNTWQTSMPAESGVLGLASFTLRFTDETEFVQTLARARTQNRIVMQDAASTRLRDFDGIETEIMHAPPLAATSVKVA